MKVSGELHLKAAKLKVLEEESRRHKLQGNFKWKEPARAGATSQLQRALT